MDNMHKFIIHSIVLSNTEIFIIYSVGVRFNYKLNLLYFNIPYA